jgi:heparanase 1
VGGGYELVDKVTFTPNPDYWAALLWQRLMGTRVLNATVVVPAANRASGRGVGAGTGVGDPDDDVVVHIMCTKTGNYTHPTRTSTGDVTLLVVNFANSTAKITINPQHVNRTEWHLRPDNPSNLTSRTAALLGVDGVWGSLHLASAGRALPELAGVAQPSDSVLAVAAHSYVFAVLHGAGATACL